MKAATMTGTPVRNLTTGEVCDPAVAHVNSNTGRLLCPCSDGLYYCDTKCGLTCPDCHTSYERIEGDMAKTSKKKAPKKQNGEKLPRAVAKVDLLTGEKVDLKKPKPSAKQKEVRVVKVTRHLKVKLTDEEIAQRSDEGAHCWAKIQMLDSEKKSFVSANKAEETKTKGRMDTLQQEVRDRCTYRDVDCNEIWDYDELVVKLVRLDTGAEFERRHMTRDELQLPLPEKKAPKADGTEKMACHGKVPEKTEKSLKEQAVERLNEDGDLTASELRARKRKQAALLDAVDAAESENGVPVEGPSIEDYEEDELEEAEADAEALAEDSDA